MKRILSILMVTAICVLPLAGQTAKSSIDSTAKKFYSPEYQRVDTDLIREAKTKNVKVKEINDRFTSGKAYLKPDNTLNRLEYLDRTNTEAEPASAIAILVDFPLNTEGESQVPGVNYPPVPNGLFNDLLNGDEYNPYQLDTFKDLETFTTPTGEVLSAPTDRTLKNYFKEVSYDNFHMNVDVVGWVTLPKTYEDYMGQNNGYYNENGEAHMGELVEDAIMAVDEFVDFSQYAVEAKPGDLWLAGDSTTYDYLDEDGNVCTTNKIVPNIFIIHRGTGAEYSTDPNVIWSHAWDIASAKYFGFYDQKGYFMDESDLKYTIADGVVLNDYNTCPEVGQDITGYLKTAYPTLVPPDYTGRAPTPAYVGVYAHEFSHVLGLPDEYDYGYDSEGVGVFTLMASGSYGRSIPNRNYSGNSPVHMDAWSKYFLGFVKPEVIVPENGLVQKISLNPVSEDDDYFRIDVPGSEGREYFILENRQESGFDVGLAYTSEGTAPHGLVVYHIIEDILLRNFDRPNEANNWSNDNRGNFAFDKGTGESHYAISVLQADGRYDLERGINDGDTADTFPGKLNITTLGSKANLPVNTSSLYKWTVGKNESGIRLENIKEQDGVITLDVVFSK